MDQLINYYEKLDKCIELLMGLCPEALEFPIENHYLKETLTKKELTQLNQKLSKIDMLVWDSPYWDGKHHYSLIYKNLMGKIQYYHKVQIILARKEPMKWHQKLSISYLWTRSNELLRQVIGHLLLPKDMK